MTAGTPARTPRVVQEAVFSHWQQMAGRLLRNLVKKREEPLRAALARNRTPGLVAWWEQQGDNLRDRAARPEVLPDFRAGVASDLDHGAALDTEEKRLSRLLAAAAIGLHFLVRQGDDPYFVYFVPSRQQLDSSDAEQYLPPYRSKEACFGLELLRLDDPDLGRGLQGIRIPLDDSDQIGSRLSISRGVCQYIPDIFDPVVRAEIGFEGLDILTRNRCSVYLPLDPSMNDAAVKLVDVFGKPRDNVTAMLIVQSAIPNLFGDKPAIAADQTRFRQVLGDDIEEGPRFFADLLRDMFVSNQMQQLAELVRYAQMLSHVSHFTVHAAQDAQNQESHKIGHSQKHIWPIVRAIYDQLAAQSTEIDPELVSLGGVFMDVMFFSSDLGLHTLEWNAIRGDGHVRRLLLRCLAQCRVFPSPADIFRRTDGELIQVLCDECRSRPDIGAASVRDSVLAVFGIELLANAMKYGNSDMPPALVWGCGHALEHAIGELLMLNAHESEWTLEPGTDAHWKEIRDADLFIGVVDTADLPRRGVSSAHREGHHGLHQLGKITQVISENSRSRSALGFGTLSPAFHKDLEDEGGFQKLTFVLLPRSKASL